MSKSPATIVLVHGAWADGSSWNQVIPLLQAKGLSVLAVQLPLTSVEDDLAATNRMVADVPGPVLLVGHSWGGVAITQAGADPKVTGLVYVAGFAPDVGETGSGLIGAHATPPALSTIVTDASGFVYQTLEGMITNIAPDLPEAQARNMAVTQGRLAGAAFGETVKVAAWKTKPTWFVISANDRVVSTELQAASAEHMNAKTTTLPSSHMSLCSHPNEVAAVIIEAANA